MARKFSEEEREAVRRKIMQEGRTLFALHGVKKTSVDDLVRASGIGKGTFYLFFPSKEDLVFELIREEYQAYGILVKRLDEKADVTPADVKGALRELFDMLSRSPLLQTLYDSGESEEISRILSKEKQTEHQQDEECFFNELFDALRKKGITPRHGPEVIRGLFNVVWLAIMNKNRIYGNAPVVDELLIDMVCRELTGE
jgi:AcrR family transcriptional regulator